MCAEIGGNQNDEIGRVRADAGPGRVGNRPILTGAAIGRQLAGLWPNSVRGSWNVKMVDGRPSGPSGPREDSVFAASLVDCVWMLLCLPPDRGMLGGIRPQGPSSLRGLCSVKTGAVSVELCLSPEHQVSLTSAALSHLSRHKIRKTTQFLPSLYVAAETGDSKVSRFS